MSFEGEVDAFSFTREERRRRAKEARLKQVEFYQAWSQAAEREGKCNGDGGSVSSEDDSPQRRKGKVSFVAKDRLRDAVIRCDINEGEAASTYLDEGVGVWGSHCK